MLNQPNPWILLIGGGALINVGMMINGAKAPVWVRQGGAGLCVLLGIVTIGLALMQYRQKKKERPRYQPKRSRPVELPPEIRPAKRPSDSPPPPAA